MTDVMSEAFGRELNARKVFEKEAVWLPLMAVHALNGGEPIITGKSFTDCVIEGPAVIAVMGHTTFEACDMGSTENPHSLLLKAQGPMLVGVVGFKDCTFLRCRFRQIGYTGHDQFVEQMKAQIASVPGGNV